jgi:DNA-binding response OmpR family regulator
MDSSRVAVVVEDDPDILRAVRQVLTASGFTVHPARTGTEGVEAVRLHEPAVVTLDLTLPDIDGFEVARQVRQFSDTYIIMLTARAEELDTLLGLESGADDYITKPFRPRELRARVEALMRRSRERPQPGHRAGSRATPSPTSPAAVVLAGPVTPAVPVLSPAGAHRGWAPGEGVSEAAAAITGGPGATVLAEGSQALEHNALWLNAGTRTVRTEEAEIHLTRTEFDLLLALMRGGRMVRTKTDLARHLREGEYDTGIFVSEAEERSVEVHIGNLRRKLGDNARRPRWVETVRGFGYRLAPARPAALAAAAPTTAPGLG